VAITLLAAVSCRKEMTMALEIVVSISSTEQKLLENDLVDIKEWIIYAVRGKINRCKKRLIREWLPKLMADNSVDIIPADEELLINLIMSRPDYKSRVERDTIDSGIRR